MIYGDVEKLLYLGYTLAEIKVDTRYHDPNERRDIFYLSTGLSNQIRSKIKELFPNEFLGVFPKKMKSKINIPKRSATCMSGFKRMPPKKIYTSSKPNPSFKPYRWLTDSRLHPKNSIPCRKMSK